MEKVSVWFSGSLAATVPTTVPLPAASEMVKVAGVTVGFSLMLVRLTVMSAVSVRLPSSSISTVMLYDGVASKFSCAPGATVILPTLSMLKTPSPLPPVMSKVWESLVSWSL